MNKKRVTALLAAVLMAAGAVPVCADEYTADIPAEVIAEAEDCAEEYEEAEEADEAAAEAVSYVQPAVAYADLTDDTAEYEADALPAKPTIAVKTAFGGKTITFSCADTDAEIYYNFGSSNITTSSKHAKVGETVFISEPMATGIYFKSYKNGKWSKEVAKWGFNNVQIAQPLIVQSGAASESKFKLYTQTSNSYMVYTLDGSEPAIEEGTQTLKVKNGRIVWGTSTVLEVPGGRTIKAIAVRCGLVTSDVMTFTSPVPPAEPTVITFPNIKDCGFTLPLIDPPTDIAGYAVKQAGGKYCSDTTASLDRYAMYLNLLKQNKFTTISAASNTDKSTGVTTVIYYVYYNNKHVGYVVGTYGVDPTYRNGNEIKTIIYVLSNEQVKK